VSFPDQKSTDGISRRRALRTSAVGLISTIATVNTVAGQSGNQTDEESGNQTTEEAEAENPDTAADDDTNSSAEGSTSGAGNEETTVCDGAPSMSRTSITTPSSQITTDDPAVVEANFRPDPTIPADCTIIVDLEFSFVDSGFQWGGGADWDQSASDFVVGTFEVQPGEIRSIQAELHTQGAEKGDQVTVQADYELWFEGNREESRQQTGIRNTINVEAPNPPPEASSTGEDESQGDGFSADSVPGFGVGSALAGIDTAGYLLKSKLSGNEE